MSDVAKSLGHHGHWGFSSGFDILELIEKASSCSDSNQSSEPINVLLIHPGDVRHIMITLARRNRHRTNTMSKQRPIHFYLFETCTEILARELVLLQIILDFEVPIRQRANVFLEVFGNLKVQKRTSRYIEELGQRLRDCMITGKGLLSSVLDFGLLKYRDKDDLETAFKGYDRSYPYDLDNYYDHRQRALYEDRYDNRRALFDWDYHGTIKSRASIVHIKQYKEWRQSGIAFEFGDQTYTEPNKTLMTFTEGFIKKGSDKGLKKEVKGFWGDISSSPYFAIGTDCETPNKFAEGLFEILNKNTGTEQHRHHAVEIALYNMFSILMEMETTKEYKMTKANDIYSGLGKEAQFLPERDEKADAVQKEEEVIIELDDEEGKPTEPADDSKEIEDAKVDQSPYAEYVKWQNNLVDDLLRAENISNILDGVKVFPLVGLPSATLDKPKYKKCFDCVYLSSRSAQLLDAEYFASLMRPNDNGFGGVVAVETGKFLTPLTKESKAELTKKETDLAAKLSLKRVDAPVYRRRKDENDTEDDVLFFVN